jgi:glycosyltransferase involved in cell wall biosynthesis
MISLHLDTQPAWRGGQNQVLLTLRGLRARGHAGELMALRGGLLAGRAAAEGFVVHAISPRLVRLDATCQLCRLLKERRFDIVHAHDPHGLTAAYLAGAHHRAALVVHRRVTFPLSRSRWALERYRAARRIVAISRFVADRVIESGLDAARVGIVHDGVELPARVTPELHQEARRSWSLADQDVLLGCVGYFVEGKGQETLIRALPSVLERVPTCRLLLVGDGPLRSHLENLARDLSVAPSVIFAGFLDDVSGAYRAMDLFLSPAQKEGLGSSLLAAMAHSLPVIAADSGGVPEVIEDGSNGLLVRGVEPRDYAKAILTLLDDRVRAARLGAAARETIEQKFTADRMVDGTIENYEKALKAAP